ncbi:5-formyltetrahydrofolate cyclo-ligase [Tepidibacter hydrothermalis]|uniref:5-formyltetrahydrofolate cyclo-ligase n=1 Tax=Tepidibacter hydrothermalis TaxID=3036126 RepID=A0ABY8ECL2_9FIRM|nr:5-formyltetrahydrofolate cyclo-ligase [Tepidibacter hydrothermalis]WFD10661.1 5-formyltetrahydrofolate cyclo-ligase [Tepidibacter hydrothermalis]
MKKEFRKKVISERKKQNPDIINSNSQLIFQNLLKLDAIKKAKTIMAYLDFNNEVQTDTIINYLLSKNQKVVVPISIVDERKLLLSQLKDIETEVSIGTYGIREPKSEFIRPVNAKDIDIVIVPAVAYDTNGYRLGYGGGYYDRFLESLRDDCITIGIAFEIQIFDEVPKEDHDAQLDYIITEKRIIKI